jgi:hypothetical protein
MRLHRVLLGAGLLFAFAGCGGNTESMCLAEPCAGLGGAAGSQGGQPSAGSPGSGGNTSGGMQGNGGAVGNGGVIGTGGTQGCCLAVAICDEGDEMLSSSASCPQAHECYKRTVCCSTIWCARPLATCNAAPSCDPGDIKISGECPPGVGCYTRSLCGSTIHCIDTACDPGAEYNRKYATRNASSCALIDFGCEANTAPFVNDCGCGCEQDPACPEYIHCEPRLEPDTIDPRCSDRTVCPLSLRLY